MSLGDSWEWETTAAALRSDDKTIITSYNSWRQGAHSKKKACHAFLLHCAWKKSCKPSISQSCWESCWLNWKSISGTPLKALRWPKSRDFRIFDAKNVSVLKKEPCFWHHKMSSFFLLAIRHIDPFFINCAHSLENWSIVTFMSRARRAKNQLFKSRSNILCEFKIRYRWCTVGHH